MYSIYLVLSVIVVTHVTCNSKESSANVHIHALEEADYHFNKYIEKHNKKYGDNEREGRFGIFKKNLQKINEFNSKKNIYLQGITWFADLNEQEFMDYAKCFSTNNMNVTDVNPIDLGSLPDAAYPVKLDYRSNGIVTEVKDQGACGCCYIFSAVGNIEGQYAKKHRQLQSLSEQEVLDCLDTAGCNGGIPHQVMQQLARFGGLVTEGDYPYRGEQEECSVNKNEIVARVTSGKIVQGGESALLKALNMYGPLAVALTVNPSLQHYTGGVFNDHTCAREELNHAVLLVGYGTDPEDGPYWLIKNSWGSSWGEQGYLRMARGAGMCRIGEYVATATVA